MPKFVVTSPDGQRYEVNAPDGATEEEAIAYVRNNMAPAKVAAKETASDPTGGFLENLAAGGGKALVDLYRGGKQVLGIGDQAALQAEIDEAKRLDAPLMQTGGGVLGNLAGNVAATAIPGGVVARGLAAVPAISAAMAARPVASAIGSGIAAGGAMGAVEPVATGESRERNMAFGAGMGAAGGAVPGVLAKIAGGANLKPQAQLLIDEGVRLTPGQALGGIVKRAEDAATSVLGLGDVIKRAQTRGLEDFNRAGFNRALAPIGEKVGHDFSIGYKGVAEVEKKISAAYDAALDNIKIVRFDGQFDHEITKLSVMVDELGEGPAKQFMTVLKNRVLDKMTPAGTMSAETMKEVESVLGQAARQWKSSADPAQRGLGDAIREVQSSLRGAVERSAGPDAAKELQAANTAWANFVRIRDASAMRGAKEGLFTAAQLGNKVEKMAGKIQTSRGTALMQGLSDAGEKVLPSSVPDSGTPTRLIANLVGGGGLHALGLSPEFLAVSALGSLPYTGLGGRATLAALAKRPEWADDLAQILRLGAPAGAMFSAGASPLLAWE